jgi:peptidyl-prolyl cis-trans isomerase C
VLATSASACSDKSKPQQAAPKAAVETKHGLTKQQAAEPLVVIGDSTITVGDFAEQLADKSPYLRARYASPERRRELLEELVKFELLAKEASRRGLDQSEEVERTKQQMMVQQMMKSEFEDKVQLSDITDQDIQAYYDAHPDEFNKPAQVRASVIIVKDEAKAKKLGKQLLEQHENNELFRQVASTQNESPELRERFGDLQFFSKPSERKDGDPPVADAIAETAFKLEKIGELSTVLTKVPEGFAIVKLTGKRKELARTLEQARRPIQHKLWRDRREAAVNSFVESLRKKADVKENWTLLEQLKVDAWSNDAGVAEAKAVPQTKTAPQTKSAPQTKTAPQRSAK